MSFPKAAFFYVSVTCLMILALTGCARSDRAILDQAQSLIDQRKYSEAVTLLEKEIPSHDHNSAMKTKLGYAYLGKSGVELLEVADKIQILKSFKSMELTSADMDVVCHNFEVANEYLPFTCFPLFKLEHFPDPEQPDFVKGLQIFTQLNPDPATTDEDINLLLAILNLGSSIKNYDHLVNVPEEYFSSEMSTSRALKVKAVTYTVKYVKRSVESFFLGVRRLMFSYGKIRRFFDKFKGQPLMKVGSHTYYATDRFSGEDIFNFLVTSVRDEASAGNTEISHEASTTLRGYGNQLSSLLYKLRLQLDFQGLSFTNVVSHYLYVGSYWIPSRMRYVFSEDRSALDIMRPENFPKAVQRVVKAGKESWSKEDAQFLFDEIDDLHEQFDRMTYLSNEWSHFWGGLDETSRDDLRFDAEHFRNQIPLLDVGPTSSPDSAALKTWYSASMNSLTEFSTQMSRNYPDERLFQDMPSLVQQSQAWIDTNLW